jgi:spermidine synthase
MVAPSEVTNAPVSRRGDERRQRRRWRVVLFAVFTLTGFSALTLQVVWQRVIALHSGVDLVSFTTVVAAFLAGLGLGSLLGGWLADRLGPARSLVAFACSNVAIAGYAFVSIRLLYDVYEDWAGDLTSAGAKFAFNVVLLIVPTTLMGLSLPLVTRGVVARVGDAGSLVGRLYALNTLGAAAGAATSGWVLQGSLGFVDTVRLAGVLNLLAAVLVGVSARSSLRSIDPGTRSLPGTKAGDDPGVSGAGQGSRTVWPWYVIYGLTGAVALGFELVFFRLVDGIMRSNSYTFAHVLASYLTVFGLGVAVGSVIVRRTDRPDRWFLGLQFLVGLCALAGVIAFVRVLPHTSVWDRAADYLTGDGLSTGFRHPDGSLNRAFGPVLLGVPLLIMAAPVACMGAAFPCAQALVSQRVETLGRHTGLLQFSNIVGNVAGTLLVGFVAIDRLGTAGTYRVLALALLVPGLAAAWLTTGGRRLLLAGAAITALSALLVLFPSNQRLWAQLNGVPRDHLMLAEDRSCATALKLVDGQWVLTVNSASQNNYPFDDYHVLIGMMPTLVHPDPDTGMALGLGIGATPYGLAVDPRLERITTVEICGGELDLLRGLADGGGFELQRFFTDPRQHLLVGDGRDHLLRTGERYDVIVVDTLRPQAAFSGSLYSEEFYELVASRLDGDGLMAQWAPSPRVTNTITEVFPHAVRVTVPQYGNSTFIVASRSPIAIDRGVLVERFRAGRDAFSPTQAASLEAYLAAAVVECLADGDPLPPVPPEAINRDLRPRDEYFVNDPGQVAARAPSGGSG